MIACKARTKPDLQWRGRWPGRTSSNGRVGFNISWPPPRDRCGPFKSWPRASWPRG